MRIVAGKWSDKCSPIIYWTFFTIELSAKRAKRCLILITWQPYRHFLPLRVIPNDDYQFLKGEPQDSRAEQETFLGLFCQSGSKLCHRHSMWQMAPSFFF